MTVVPVLPVPLLPHLTLTYPFVGKLCCVDKIGNYIKVANFFGTTPKSLYPCIPCTLAIHISAFFIFLHPLYLCNPRIPLSFMSLHSLHHCFPYIPAFFNPCISYIPAFFIFLHPLHPHIPYILVSLTSLYPTYFCISNVSYQQKSCKIRSFFCR